MFFTFNREYVVKTTMKNLNLTKKEAGNRIDALLKSGILEKGSPDDAMTQLLIENFLRFDLTKLEYREVLRETLNFPALIAEYDKREGQHLGKALRALRNGGDYLFEDIRDQIKAFDNFFCDNIWNRFPNVSKY